MTETALKQRGETGESHWVKRTAAVTFCLLLVSALALVFTRVIAARVPEQRATLEKLITDRTGLNVRFDNIHFAWGLDGTSAVFTRVELTDPQRGRIRVVAPELRVKFDTWDFLRHHQFSLGHVTLASPDIEIYGDAEPAAGREAAPPAAKRGETRAPQDAEAALVRRYTSWAALMPIGRIEVEGARVHLLRRGGRGSRQSFSLSQGVVSRGNSSFNAYGTLLLSQDVGQSLFVSANLTGLGANTAPSGELRLIARRVFLDKLALGGLNGRGTLDAKLRLESGHVHSATWQASARDLELPNGERFDHLSVGGKLAREGKAEVLIDFTNLQVTRGARLDRAPLLAARLQLDPRSLHIARTRIEAARAPFLAAEFLSGMLAPQLTRSLPQIDSAWRPLAGELRDLRFDSGERQRNPDAWTFSAQIVELDLARDSDHARLAAIAGRVEFNAQALRVSFDPANKIRVSRGSEDGYDLALRGAVRLTGGARQEWAFEDLAAQLGEARIVADGRWSPEAAPLKIAVTNLDRTVLVDVLSMAAPAAPLPKALADLDSARILSAQLALLPALGPSRALAVNWNKSSGAGTVANLATVSTRTPGLVRGDGAFSFSRGAARLVLSGGELDGMALTSAALDWPKQGPPRLRAALAGDLRAPLLKEALAAQGLERMSGTVVLETEARGEAELQTPEKWRVTARLADATLPLAGDAPPIERLSGTLRLSAGDLRSLKLSGRWLGGPLAIESRRGAARGAWTLELSGQAASQPLLELLGQRETGGRVRGELTWSGTAQRLDQGDWRLALAGDLVGVESSLPAPFDKPRLRALPFSAQLHLDRSGLREFEILSDGDSWLRGELHGRALTAKFQVHEVSGDLRRAAQEGTPMEVRIARLAARDSAEVFAAAGALLPQGGALNLNVADLRVGERSLGSLQAALQRNSRALKFDVASPEVSVHRLNARGECVVADGLCKSAFTVDTTELGALLRDLGLPEDFPQEKLLASGELAWPMDSAGDVARMLVGRFDIEAQGRQSAHQWVANAQVSEGTVQLSNIQGTGPEPDQLLRGSGRIGLVSRDYDLTVDYEQVSLAATAVPTPARARLARAWTALRGSVARRGWTPAPEVRHVQWHGSWDTAR